MRVQGRFVCVRQREREREKERDIEERAMVGRRE